MKVITVSIRCDRCGATIVGPPTLAMEATLGHPGCVTARADLCVDCLKLFHAWLGKSWNELRKQNELEADEGGRPI